MTPPARTTNPRQDTSHDAPTDLLAAEGQLAHVDLGRFRTEAGAFIPGAQLAYQRWGKFRGDPAGKNNVLLLSLIHI